MRKIPSPFPPSSLEGWAHVKVEAEVQVSPDMLLRGMPFSRTSLSSLPQSSSLLSESHGALHTFSWPISPYMHFRFWPYKWTVIFIHLHKLSIGRGLNIHFLEQPRIIRFPNTFLPSFLHIKRKIDVPSFTRWYP
jgi:hypothetical protein